MENIKINPADFEHVGTNFSEADVISRPSISYWKDAMNRLFKNKVAVVCMAYIFILLICSIVLPMLSPYTMTEQHIAHSYKEAMYTAADGHVHILGTDDLGRDIYTRIWYGARISMYIAFAAVFINVAIGVVYGGIAGYFGGVVDSVMMRFVEIIIGIPYLIIVILLMMVLPQGVNTMVIAYATVSWTGMARLVRGQIIGLKEQEYVIAAKSLGASPSRIIAKHLLPNTLSVIIINITLAIPAAIFTEAFLSFIGLGVPIPYASWGTLANEGTKVFQQYPLQLAVPATFISLTMLSFNLLGDALRDAFDPRLRR